MPGRDNSGPQGFGPATGRGLGNCTPSKSNTFNNSGRGFGMGSGRGMSNPRGFNNGRGFRFWQQNTASENSQTSGLMDEILSLKEKLVNLENKISGKNE